MSNSTDLLTKVQLSALLGKYIPSFEKHGVKCRLSVKVFTQTAVHSLDDDQEQSINHFLYNARALLTGLVDEAVETQIENYKYVRIPCLVLHFHPSEPSAHLNKYKQYSFPLRKQTDGRTRRVPEERILRKMDRILMRKEVLLSSQSPERVCKNTIWDYLRYIFGHYGYMQTIGCLSHEAALVCSIAIPIAVLLVIFLTLLQ